MKNKIFFFYLFFFFLISYFYLNFRITSYVIDVRREIFYLRLFRYFLCLFTGMVLTTSGSVMQVIFNNPLMDPYVLGISGGALFGFTLSGIFFRGNLFVSLFFSFIFSILAALISLSFSLSLKGDKKITLILSGLLTNILFSSLVIILSIVSKNDSTSLFYSMMGSLNHPFIRSNLNFYLFIGFLLVLSLFLILIKSKELDMISINEEIAKTSGVDVKKNFYILLVVVIFQTSIIVSFTGVIGFVGIVIPNIIKISGRMKNREIFFNSIIIGAILVLLADFISKYSFQYEIPVGVVLSLFSLPLLFLIVKINFENL